MDWMDVRGTGDVAEHVAPGAGAVVPKATERDVQRGALRELVRLIQECSTTEAALERQLADGLAQAEQQFTKSQNERSALHKVQVDEISAGAEDQTQRHDTAVAAARKQAKAEDEATRRQIELQCVNIEYEAKQQLDKAVWLAESVLEATQNAARDEARNADKEHTERVERITELRNKALKLMAEYGLMEQVAALERSVVVAGAGAGEGEITASGLAREARPGGPPLQQFEAELKLLDRRVQTLGRLVLPRVFSGATLYLVPVCLALAAGLWAQFAHGGVPTDLSSPQWAWHQIGAAAGITLLVAGILGVLLQQVGRQQVRRCYVPLHEGVIWANHHADDVLFEAEQARNARLEAAKAQREQEISAMKAKVTPVVQRARAKKDADTEAQRQAFAAQMAALDDRHARTREEIQVRGGQELAAASSSFVTDQGMIAQRHRAQLAAAQTSFDQQYAALHRKWEQGLARIRAPMGTQPTGAVPGDSSSGGNGHSDASAAGDGPGDGAAQASSRARSAPADWDDPGWASWVPTRQFDPRVRFGTLEIDVKRLADELARPSSSSPRANAAILGENGDSEDSNQPAGAQFAPAPVKGPPPHRLKLPMPDDFLVPALLAFPRQASLLIQHEHVGRPRAIDSLQMVMARLLTTQPAGRVRFTIFDPVGLGQNFAGFMHLADYDEALVGTRIWTNSEQIEQRLADLAEHMETVIQKYLRNEFPTIDEYNAQAGELAEPYRFLVIADYPTGFSPEACRKLASIAGTGARCGVYTLISRDLRVAMPQGAHIEDLEGPSVNLLPIAGKRPAAFRWEDDVFRRFPLQLDDAPAEGSLTALLQRVGRFAKEANRVEVPFSTITPPAEKMWSCDASLEIKVPIGRSGATRLQSLRLGRGVAQHALIAGKTGSGKSTLLNAIVTNAAMWYSPREIELYLVDFKKGVEFKAYGTHSLPHARAVAVESDREFGLSVLQRIDAELTRRGELFRRAGVQDLAAYREALGKVAGAEHLPRVMLIIDEFQEFFSEDDKLAQDAAVLIDRLVRQGRAFGTHVLLGSQTIGGTSGLSRSTLGQMAVRIALQCTEADSQLILGDDNLAARLLSRPGEAIYNDAGGLVENNSPFQIAWLPDDQREQCLGKIREAARRAAGDGATTREPLIFEGNAPAEIARNRRLAGMLERAQANWAAGGTSGGAAGGVAAPLIYLGDPVAIKEPTAVQFRAQAASNALIVGQQEEQAMALMISAILSLAAQLPPARCVINVLDGTPADSELSRWLPLMKQLLPRHEIRLVDYRHSADAIIALGQEVARRQSVDDRNAPSIFLLVYGLQRYRMLRKQEDDFSFSGDAEKPPDPAKLFATILREGPALGVHTVAWCDTLASVERTLDRVVMRELDNRVLFQMSANDSSALIDSPAANKLGANRAVAYSEERGTLEKFRPYGLPPEGWLAEACEKLTRAAG
jgi:DNA segregation ATPase FtsK/SpoIIIE, S-DNA-T family